MSLILCRQEPVRHPYYFENLGIHLYSSQELSYVIYNHPLLVLDGFVDDHLIEFIRSELDMEFLAAKLEKWIQSGEDLDELLLIILQECCYYTPEEISAFSQKITAYRKMRPAVYEKTKADYLFGQMQYGRAIHGYEKLISAREEHSEDDEFWARVYNNLAASYSRMFLFEKALAAYESSCYLEKDATVLRKMYYISLLDPARAMKESYLPFVTEELKKEWDDKLKEAMENAKKAESLKQLEELFARDPIKRLTGAGVMVKKWKQEYRNMV